MMSQSGHADTGRTRRLRGHGADDMIRPPMIRAQWQARHHQHAVTIDGLDGRHKSGA
jgi:hypothetical protein